MCRANDDGLACLHLSGADLPDAHEGGVGVMGERFHQGGEQGCVDYPAMK